MSDDRETLVEFAQDVIIQFGNYVEHDDGLYVSSGGLSTLEWAFQLAGWDDPHPVPEYSCERDGCHAHATIGMMTDDGYMRLCGVHGREEHARQKGRR